MMAPDGDSRRREADFVQWLDVVKNDAAVIFLLGDIFDFWFEYRYVVPRGFVRLLGKLAELTDSGIPVHFFTGNHDQWVRDYLTHELNIIVHRHSTEFELNGKMFLIGHGHDNSLEGFIDRVLHVAFSSRFLHMLYASLHPFWGIKFGKNWSKNTRKRRKQPKPFKEPEKEHIIRYAQKALAHKHYDFFVFGHRHLSMDIRLEENSRYINTGEWIDTRTYAVFDGEDVSLHSAKDEREFLKL